MSIAATQPVSAAAELAADADSRTIDLYALPAGTRLDKFEILQVLGAGGFGIVYLALDHTLERHVAIKEYMPSALAARGPGTSRVTLRSASHAETYALGLRSFVNEARLLAGFDHPSLVKVHEFWEAHGTAYMAMHYYQGRTLHCERRAMHGPPCEEWLRGITEPLLSALELLHRQGVFHRDISPDNIIVLPSGRPVLLDFGAARRVVGDRTQALTAILKPDFAPVEQYADVPNMRQGAWTDLYALGAVVHFMLKGFPPLPAVTRAVQDDMPALSTQAGASLSGVSAPFLAAIDWALAIAPKDRPQSVQALRAALDGKALPPRSARRRGQTTTSVVMHQASGPAPRTIRALHGRYAPTRLVATFHAAGSSSGTDDQKARRKLWHGARGLIALMATIAASALALGSWQLSGRVTPKPVAPVAVDVKPKAQQPIARDRATTVPARQSAKASVVEPAAGDPQAACADRNFLARPICVGLQCREAQFARHPVCVQLQRDEERRQQAQINR
jgi:serine/threonine protein kinase